MALVSFLPHPRHIFPTLQIRLLNWPQGKSTLGKVLSRIVDFNGGELLINDVDVRRYEPAGVTSCNHRSLSKFLASTTAPLPRTLE